jgi:hypothetical protein
MTNNIVHCVRDPLHYSISSKMPRLDRPWWSSLQSLSFALQNNPTLLTPRHRNKLIPFFIVSRLALFSAEGCAKGCIDLHIYHSYCRIELEIRTLPTVPSLTSSPTFKWAEPVFNCKTSFVKHSYILPVRFS